MNIAKTIELNTKDGRKMIIEVSDVLMQRIVEAYGLRDVENVESRHVEGYLISSMKKALEN